jgi:hypothetical protein
MIDSIIKALDAGRDCAIAAAEADYQSAQHLERQGMQGSAARAHESYKQRMAALQVIEAARTQARLLPELVAALRWALSQIEDDLDPDHRAALTGARKVLAQAERGRQ